MRLLLWTFVISCFVIGCASSSKNNVDPESYENLTSIQKPGEKPFKQAKVYIDSVKMVWVNNHPALLINGTFPDGCTKLQEVTHRIHNDSLYLDMKAWRNPNMMCTQALTPFTYIYDQLSKKHYQSYNHININSTTFSF